LHQQAIDSRLTEMVENADALTELREADSPVDIEVLRAGVKEILICASETRNKTDDSQIESLEKCIEFALQHCIHGPIYEDDPGSQTKLLRCQGFGSYPIDAYFQQP